ncbi:hypothetical protein ACHQM5_017017 [Ranunculus cassubicifolius]
MDVAADILQYKQPNGASNKGKPFVSTAFTTMSVEDTRVFHNVEAILVADEGEFAECSIDNDVSLSPNLNQVDLSDFVLAAPLESLRIGEVVLECEVNDVVLHDSAMILSTQPVHGGATSLSESAGESVGQESVVNKKPNVDIEKGFVIVTHMGVQKLDNFDHSLTVNTPPTAATVDTLPTLVTHDGSVKDDIKLMKQQTAVEKVGAFLYDKEFVTASCSVKIAPNADTSRSSIYVPRLFAYSIASSPPELSSRSLMYPWCFDPGIISILLCKCEEIISNVHVVMEFPNIYKLMVHVVHNVKVDGNLSYTGSVIDSDGQTGNFWNGDKYLVWLEVATVRTPTGVIRFASLIVCICFDPGILLTGFYAFKGGFVAGQITVVLSVVVTVQETPGVLSISFSAELDITGFHVLFVRSLSARICNYQSRGLCFTYHRYFQFSFLKLQWVLEIASGLGMNL